MLKLYVECTTRIYSMSSSFKDRRNEEGFVSAETIAIAVAGVLIVGGVYILFRNQLRTAIEALFDRIGAWETDDGPA